MTGSLRSTARNPVAIALMGLLILVFLLLGVGGGSRFPDMFRGGRADSVVTAGGHTTSAIEYRRIFDQQKQRYEAQTKAPTTTEFLVKNGFDQQLLNQIALDQSAGEMLSRMGVAPDASLIDAQIKQIPAAFDRVTGKFSEKQFLQFLGSQGLTPQQVQTDLTDELAQRHFAFAVVAGFRVPRAYAALTAIAALQNRDVRYFDLDARAIVQPPPPTDAQLLAFMKANTAQLTRPEMRIVELARFSASALAPSVVVSAADIQKEFDFRKDSLSTPETRDIVQIPVRSAAEGAQAASRLKAGEDPAAVARAFGAEAVTYSAKPRAALADAKIAAAAFSMTQGEVAGPVKGDLGLAAVKVVKITPARVATLDSARAQIEADLKSKAARNKAYELSQKFDDARQAGASVADAARKAGVALQTVGPITGDGIGVDGKPNPLVNDKIAKSAFAMRAGEDSDVQDAGSGEYFALHIDKVIAPALPALNEIRAPLTQALQRQQLIAALRAKADSLMAEIRAGKSMEVVAASIGSHVVSQPGMQLVKAQDYKALGREFLTQVFAQKPGEVFAASSADGAYIAHLDAIRPGDVTQTAQVLENVRQRASQDYLQDLLTTTKAAAEKLIGVNINLNLARQTVGVDPASVAGPVKKGATKSQ
jgi:peptidyl-prolyl cis-trans isomerase D